MIIAKYEYAKNLAWSPKSKKRKMMDEFIEVVDEIWSLDATIALKQFEKDANSKETSELIIVQCHKRNKIGLNGQILT